MTNVAEILATIKPYRLCSQVKKAVCEKYDVDDSIEIICACVFHKKSIIGIFRFSDNCKNQVYDVTLDEYYKGLEMGKLI